MARAVVACAVVTRPVVIRPVVIRGDGKGAVHTRSSLQASSGAFQRPEQRRTTDTLSD